jgi:hypothetical protein
VALAILAVDITEKKTTMMIIILTKAMMKTIMIITVMQVRLVLPVHIHHPQQAAAECIQAITQADIQAQSHLILTDMKADGRVST